MKAAALALMFVCAIPFLGQNAAPAQNPGLPKMKQYFVGLLLKGENFNAKISQAEHDRLFQGHLAYVRSQAEAGKYRLAGPFRDDGKIAGLLIIDAPTADEATKIVSGDPMVKAGIVAFELHPALLEDMSCVRTEYPNNSGSSDNLPR